MQTKVMKLGFIGGGINSAVGRVHIIASQMDGRFKVEAGCFSRHAEVNTKTADVWNIPADRRYRRWAELLERERGRLDAVVVLTPTPNHAEPVIGALEQGYAVICEKALTHSSAEALRIRHTLANYPGFLAVTFNYSGYPMVRELRSLIKAGRLGRLTQLHVEMPQEGFARLNRQGEPMKPQQWRLEDGVVPGISLDLGTHVHHLIDFLTGEKPVELVAHESSLGHFRQVIDNTVCIARYTNNIDCSIWFSKAALGHRNGLRLRIFGDAGSAEWYQLEPEFLTFNDKSGRKNVIDRASADVEVSHEERYNRFKSGHPSGYLEAFASLYSDIADSLQAFQETGQQDSEFVFSVDHALEGLLMMEAISKSARERSWQAVSFDNIPKRAR